MRVAPGLSFHLLTLPVLVQMRKQIALRANTDWIALKTRLDKLLVERGLVPSRERAQALILAGRVLVDEQRVDKAGAPTEAEAVLRLLGDDMKFVGRGGLKLDAALEYWKIDVAGLACVDVGASTGGFTDCMLQRGAASVLAIDTGHGQIAEKLRRDERVSLMEKTNARLLAPGSLAGRGLAGRNLDFWAMDVSFISATLVMPAVLAALSEDAAWQGWMVVLVKPQFEAGREAVGKGGIVRDQAARQFAIDRVAQAADALGGTELDVIDSPITGMEGNHEYLLRARFG
jgi:23S rRNA (cytidine1920-2'-O)/16S rRNA (cytidine1409-2'-O)-methyltransferase